MFDATIFQSALQPLQKLAQSNMGLITRFSTSPEVTSQAMSDAQKLFQQTQETVLKLVQSQAFAGMTQGFIKNYTEFLTEMSQGMTSMASQGQAAFMKQATDATTGAMAATQAGVQRLRSAT